jgi:hypothetical protein
VAGAAGSADTARMKSFGGRGTALKIRKLALVGIAPVVLAAVAIGPALAQDLPETEISADVKFSPSTGGTAKHPQGIQARILGRLTVEPGFEPPIVTGMDLLVGPGLSWNGADYVKCSKRVLDRKGPKGCPEKSIMGHGLATGHADTAKATLRIVLVNGGSRILAYATLDNPARVRETIVVKPRSKSTGRWRHRESFRIPESLQVVAGVPIRLSRLKLIVGGKPYARNYIATTSCPKSGWRWHATVHYLYDSTGQTATDTLSGEVPCRR